MRLGLFKRIVKNDFAPDEQSLIEKLSFTLNTSLESLFNALSNNLTLGDNIACTVKQVDVDLDTNGVPKQTVGFSVNFMGRVSIVQVGKAENLTNSSSYPTGAPFVTFLQSDKNIFIQHVTGLQPNTKYRLTIVAFKE